MAENLLHILLVEDDSRLADLTREYLERHGAVVTVLADGESALRTARRHRFDIVLLDVMLPGKNGFEICRKLRELSAVPIVMLTARGEEADRVLGLELGADDYVPKPFSPRELLARIQAILRRTHAPAGPRAAALAVDDLLLDPGALTAQLAGRRLDLTSYEFALLYALAERAGRVLSREQLMELAKGNCEEAFDRSIDVHISRLRQKLGDDPHQPRRIRTIRGVGYQYLAGETE